MGKLQKFIKKLQNIATKFGFSVKKLTFFIHPMTIFLIFASYFVGLFGVTLTYILCLLLHELCHAIVARKLGYRADKIVLYPTGALLFGETDEFENNDEIIVALAGPLANLILVILTVFLWWIFPQVYDYSANFLVANLSLALFNLLPVYPMDGGRVLLGVLSKRYSRRVACKIVKTVAIVFSLCLFCIFVLSLFFVPFFQIGIMSFVLFVSAISEDKKLAYKRFNRAEIKRKKLCHGLKKVTLAFSCGTKLAKVLSRIDNFAIYQIEIYDENFDKLATFDEKQIENLAIQYGLSTTLGELATLI